MSAPLVFFDSNGNCINFRYDSVSSTYNGELILDNNGSDTFKTIGLYTFENIPSFEFESGSLYLEKFQIFNEYGFNITGSKYIYQVVSKIEAVNNDSSFYSKWIYGINFESKFPIGSEIRFDNDIFEFTNPLKTYTIVSSKKGAIMILSTLDNKTFNNEYQLSSLISSSYNNITISGINSIGINSYLNQNLSNNLSNWSEPQFYLNLYNNRQLNIVNTNSNNSVVTIKNKDLLDKVYYKYSINSSDLPPNSDLLIELTLKTNLPIAYSGELILSGKTISFINGVPSLLKPGSQFSINGSILNSSYINISSIPTFSGNNQPNYYYATASQVLWNNTIYQCYQSYTQSATSSVTPDDINYWGSNITYLPTTQNLNSESIIYGEVYLTTNKFYYGVSGSSDSNLTLAFAGEKYVSNFSYFNIDLSYDNSELTSSLNYSTNYAQIEYYYVQSGITYSITNTQKSFEKTIEVSETLINEFNRNISTRYSYDILFTSLDNYGLIITINGLVYQQETQWVYSGLSVDMSSTINFTLSSWVDAFGDILNRLGITPNLSSSTGGNFDRITISTIYPNIPLQFSIGVGVVANYVINHSNIVFYEIGNTLSITINGILYSVLYSTSISSTLSFWISSYYSILEGYGIYTSSSNNTLFFDIKSQSTLLEYTVNIGKSIQPGSTVYEINSNISGNSGSIITSNAVVLSSTQSFLDDNPLTSDGVAFATGMITSVNNTIYPYNNQEYNIIGVDSQRLVLSYQGPFWGATTSIYTSPFIIPAFSDGFTSSLVFAGGTYSDLSDGYTFSSYTGSIDSQYGTLDPSYESRQNIWLKTRSYIRKPRENYEGDFPVEYVWSWETDETPEIFMYDFTGTQLPIDGSFGYIGEKPLQNINLNRYSNSDVSKTASSAYQQTIFSEIINQVDYINSTTDVSYTPEPLELFIGFNSKEEGVKSSILILSKREEISFNISASSVNSNNITFQTTFDTSTNLPYGTITLDSNSIDSFLYNLDGSSRGLKVGQTIQVFVKDITNTNSKYISLNNGIKFIITEIYIRSIVIKFVDDIFTNESTIISNYPSPSINTYLSVSFNVIDTQIGRFIITGQTEIEDIRYKTELTNLGKNITVDDIFIFKTYDINEQGVDWLFLNQKRKEMLLVKDLIYPYIGSYKAIINAINYFGYNDLELYEYYRNINTNSTAYGSLFKVEISGIFDNNVPGWDSVDYLKWTMPNPNYEDTNLFNLTYRITDIDGNNTLLYSLSEVLIKLQGLKGWLERNVIPISHKILDITGRADIPAINSIIHKNYHIRSFNIDQSMSPIDVNMNEAYLMPINSGSTVYNVVLDFNYKDFDPYNYSVNSIPDYFGLKVRTYHTYPEWRPFKSYQNGSIVEYYQQNYTSVIDENRLNDPRKYQNSTSWSSSFSYTQGQIIEYNRNFYEFLGTQSVASIVTPFSDVLNSYGNWKDVTEWRKVDYIPIQSFNEFRTGTHSYHFTLDSNIDPYITIEVKSDNGYGQNYTVRKNYEIRSILDIDEDEGQMDVIGPVKIINFLTSTTTTTTTTQIIRLERWVGIDNYCEDVSTQWIGVDVYCEIKTV